ncbi:MAG: DUF448 domain-containing protein [Parvibaculales bacterium]
MQQQCRQTGMMADAADMLRFVPSPEGVLTPDLAGKLPGEAVWLHNRRSVVQAFDDSRAAQGGRGCLAAQVDALLEARALSLVGLARKAGAIVSGFAKTRAVLQNGRAEILLGACDGAEDGRAKLARLAQATGLPVLEPFTAAQLGVAIGRSNVIHAALTHQGWAHRVENEVRRLVVYRTEDPGQTQVEDRSEG